MIKNRAVLLALIALAAAACNMTPPGATSAPGSSTIANTDWVLSSIADTPMVSGTEVTLLFTFAKAAGFGGCNQYSSTYASDGSSTLSFGPIAATRMACVGAPGTLETAYLAALGRVRGYLDRGHAALAVR